MGISGDVVIEWGDAALATFKAVIRRRQIELSMNSNIVLIAFSSDITSYGCIPLDIRCPRRSAHWR